MQRGRISTFRLFWATAFVLLSANPLGLFAQQAAGAGKSTSKDSPAATKTTDAKNPPASAWANESSHGSKPTLLDFAWLEGKWQGTWGPRVVEQIWTAPRAGQMLGLFRVVENDKTLVIELFSLFETPDGVELQFRHFTPALAPWEQSSLTTLKLASLDAKTAVFENPADGQPKHDVFTRIDPDTYASQSEIVLEAGGTHVTEIRYHRQK